jgi:hypothetical protein
VRRAEKFIVKVVRQKNVLNVEELRASIVKILAKFVEKFFVVHI